MRVNSPTSIGRYEVLSEIGRGTMGIVYKARDPEIDRVVAIKTIFCLDLDPSDQKEYRERYEELTGRSLRQCPHCRQGEMVKVAILPKPFVTPPRMDSS